MKFKGFSFVLVGFLVGQASAVVDPIVEAEASIKVGHECSETPTMRLASEICPQYGVRAEFARAMVWKESKCGTMMSFREHSPLWDRVITKKLKVPRGTVAYEKLSTSYGALGLGGLWFYLEDKRDPTELFDDEENLHKGCQWLKRGLDSCKGKNLDRQGKVRSREFCAAAKHNGGPNGMGNAQATAYAEVVSKMIGRV